MVKIEYVAIDRLKEHPNNPRTIQDDDFERLVESIKKNKEFFEVRPILANEKGIVFAGNQRLKAAKFLGMEKVPAAFMDVTEEQEKELMIRDNIANGEWDYALLSDTFDVEMLLSLGMDMPKNMDIDYSNEEIDTGELTEDLNTTCPKCGFEFEA